MADVNRAPPFYRPDDINPMTDILADKALLAPPSVTLTIDEVVVSGTYEFGSIGDATQVDFGGFWDTTGYANNEAGFFRACLLVYDGDSGAFNFAGKDLTDGDNDGFFLTPGFLPTAFGQNLTALAADDGVEKTGTVTLYANIIDGAPANLVATITLSKTYNAP